MPVAPEAQLAADYAHCARIARHAENFPVASRLLPARFRPHLAAVYAYARGADDVADEASPRIGEAAVAADADSRLAALDAWERGLDGDVPPGTEPVFRALAASRRARSLPDGELRRLIEAFRYDVRHQGYATWEDLLAYARNSAAAIGRLVLSVAAVDDPDLIGASDDLCVALQLTNFWQDLSRDMPRGRITLPESIWRSKSFDAARLRTDGWGVTSAANRTRLTSALDIAIARTEELFQRSRKLPAQSGPALASYLGAVWIGGHTILSRVRELGPRAFLERPSLTWTDRAAIAWRAVVTRA